MPMNANECIPICTNIQPIHARHAIELPAARASFRLPYRVRDLRTYAGTLVPAPLGWAWAWALGSRSRSPSRDKAFGPVPSRSRSRSRWWWWAAAARWSEGLQILLVVLLFFARRGGASCPVRSVGRGRGWMHLMTTAATASTAITHDDGGR